jgi:ATP-binding cassette, subfamily B, bacterial
VKAVVALTTVVPDEEQHRQLKPIAFLRLLRRLFAFARPHAVKRNWLIVTVLLRAAQLPALAWAIAAIINGPIARSDPRGVALGAIGFLALAMITQVTFYYRMRLALEFGEAVIHDLRNHLFAHLQTLTMGFFDKTKIGRIIGRMTSDIEAVRIGVQDLVFISAVQGGQMIICAVLMLWYDWALFLVVAAIAPAIWVLNRHFRTKLSTAHREAQESFSRVTATLAESVGGMRVTQGFVRQQVNAQIFRDLVHDHSRYNIGAARTTAVFLPLLELNSQIFIAVLLALGGYRVLHMGMPVGDMIYFFFLANLFFEPVRVISNQYTQSITAMVGAERVFRLLDTKPEWTDPPDASPFENIRGRVAFKDVCFSYDSGKLVLKNISFLAEPGQTIAFVGHTGSGKTSIINLIAKLYLPIEGQLLIDGHDIRAISSQSLHKRLGVVLQQNFLFQGTVLDNIRFANPGLTEYEALDAARQLNFSDLINALPKGLHTPMGEDGVGLSVGQRQVICFIRALVADPAILILDEATSSIDPVTEARLQQSMATLLKDRTSFIVAHRLSTVRLADQILVLKQGEIVERGTHRELLNLGGVYSNLHEQFVRG